MTLLIVDDSTIIRGAIEDWIEDLGLEVVGRAADGRQAVQMAAELRPDIITLDISMPEMDGLTAMDHILDAHPAARIVVVSALAGKETALAAMKKGAVSFLVKPFTRLELHEVLSEVTQGGVMDEQKLEVFIRSVVEYFGKMTGAVTRSLLVCSLLALLAAASPLHAAPVLGVDDYARIRSFSGEPVVLITRGDDPSYAGVELDDSAWAVVSVPSEWSDLYPGYNGVCWYRLHVRFPEGPPPAAVGLRLGIITDADETWFNGRRIGSSGSVDPPFASAYDKERLYEIPSSLIDPGGDNVVAIRVRGIFSYSNGPFTGSFAVGPFGELQKSLYVREFLKLFLVVVYLVVAVYFLMFFARRPAELANLFFGACSLAIGLYFALRTQAKHFAGLDFYACKKIEYLLLATLVPLIVEFLTFTLRRRHTVFHFIFLALAGVHLLVYLASTSYVFWDHYNQYVQIPSWALGVGLAFVMLLGSVRTDPDARLILVAGVVLLLTMVNDVLVNMVAYDFIRLASYGFAFFVVAIALFLSGRFVRLYGEVENLNRNLEGRVRDRTDELGRTVVDLEAAKAQTDSLLENVKEGIFLLDRSHLIGAHHSRMLESIFERADLAGMSLVDLLREVADPACAEQTAEFLDLALTRRLSDKRLRALNPVAEVDIRVKAADGRVRDKHLRFTFARIGDPADSARLLATVEDATEETELGRRVRESERRAGEEMKLLVGILHLSPDVARRFLEEARAEMAAVRASLESAGFAPDLRALLDSVYRSVHSIKGNAGVLGLDMFARRSHEFEEKIRGLFGKADLSAPDLVGLLYCIVGMEEALSQVEELLGRIAGFKREFGSGESGASERSILMQTARDLAARVALREGKLVSVEFGDFEVPEDGSVDLRSLRKVMVQLVKNSVAHGIESPEAREASGKARAGTITVASSVDGAGMTLTVTDDGCGIPVEEVRRRAAEAGIRTSGEMEGWSAQRIADLCFESGLSTRPLATLDAGRGVGLDLVRHEVERAGGRVALSFEPGARTRFTVTLPRGAHGLTTPA